MDSSYPAAVSVSPRGNLLVKHSESELITLFNGYSRNVIRAPVIHNFRVYESKTGQLWSLDHRGLMAYLGGTWTMHPVPLIEQELVRNPLRQIRQIPLLPAELNRVFILLENAFLEYDGLSRQVKVLKRAIDTQLGTFVEMQEAPDEGIWISGTYGMAKVPGPLRQLSSATPWTELLLPNPEIFAQVQRVHESASGVLTSLCSSPEGSGRYIFQYREGNFQFHDISSERPRQAWTAWDEQLWGFSYNSIFRVVPTQPPVLLKELAPGAHFDVTVQANGVFWLASSEGLIRFAPTLWRPAPRLENLQMPIHSILFPPGEADRFWMASPEGLHLSSPKGVELFPWPGEQTKPQGGTHLLRTLDGRILVTGTREAIWFSPQTREFKAVEFNGVPIGQFRDGSIAVKSRQDTNTVLLRLNGEEFSPSAIPSQIPAVREATHFLESRAGDYWVAGVAGIAVFRTSENSWEQFTSAEGLGSERISCLVEVAENRFMAGTADRIMEWTGRRWEVAQVVGERVLSIEPGEDGSVWAATAAGVFRRVGEAWLAHGPAEGLASTMIYQMRIDPRRKVWAATSLGLSVYDPEADTDSPRTLDPVIIQPQTPTTAEPLLVSLRAMDKWDHTDPSDLLFSYRLDEGPWSIFQPRSTVAFAQVSSGDHRLEVRAMDRNGNVDPLLGVLEFTAIVPWFRDPRLIIVSVLALSGVVFFAGVAIKKHLELRRSYAEVEQKVRERTRDLEKANQELLHSQKMRAIGTMAAGIAHDFNNILSIIKGSAQIIESNPHDEEKIRTRTDRIQTVVEQGSSIVRALLGLGRVTETPLARCTGHNLLEEAGRLLADRFGEKVHLEIIAPETLPQFECAREVVQQMLINLILNAADAIGGRGTIVLRADSGSEPAQGVVLPPTGLGSAAIILSVEDRGSGISPEIMPRIFEPFFTTKAFSSRRGTGLGLSMVYELAKAMGYGLAVQSSEGQGSAFQIIIPLRGAAGSS